MEIFSKVVLLFFLIVPFTIFSQINISGRIISEENTPIPQAYVTAANSENVILAYGITNKEGEFRIQLNSDLEHLILKVRALNYAFHSEIIENKSQSFEIILSPEITVLDEVFIKQRPIRQKGDTLSYNVSAFQEQKDRVIADVLKKMPGIEIDLNGRIIYQGNPINKYYIEGLDLLEGKYSLANENLPADAVSSVQILENHQPIKMLDSIVYSDKTALNIKLKKNITTTGIAELGAGFSPMLWKANVTPMLFNKNQQMISSYQGNNTGEDVSLQLEILTLTDLINQSEIHSNYNWLNISNVLTPPIADKRWLDNEIHLGTINYLTKWKNNYDFRINASYYNDYQKLFSESSTLYFLSTDTLKITENRRNLKLTNNVSTKFTLTQNDKSTYFENATEFRGNWENSHGLLNNLNETIDQKTRKPLWLISNRFSTIRPIGKELINISSMISWQQSQENLMINPGQFSDILNDSIALYGNYQSLDFSRFFTENSLGVTKQLRSFTIYPKIGLQYISQNFESNLFNLLDENQFVPNNSNFQNDLNWNQFKNYLNFGIHYRKNNWKASLNLPLNYFLISVRDNSLNQKISKEKIFVLPDLSVNFQPNTYWIINIHAFLNHDFVNINKLYFSYILQNYRTLQRIKSTVIPEAFGQNYSASIQYKNPIKSIFANLNYNFSTIQNSVIYNQTMDESGNSLIDAQEKNNTSERYSVIGKISKYISKLKSTFTLSVNYLTQRQKQFLNNELSDIENFGWGFGVKINSNPLDWLSIGYDGKLSMIQNQINAIENRRIKTQTHSFSVNLYPYKNHYIGFSTDYFTNNFSKNNQETTFLDLTYRFTFPKTKIDMELSWNNIFNSDLFTNALSYSFYYSEQTIQLRPSQLFLKVKFSF